MHYKQRLEQLQRELKRRGLEPWQREQILQTIHYIECECKPKQDKRTSVQHKRRI